MHYITFEHAEAARTIGFVPCRTVDGHVSFYPEEVARDREAAGHLDVIDWEPAPAAAAAA